MRQEYIHTDIETVFKYYADGFQIPDGEKIHNYETTYDPRTGKVIFRLFVDKKDKK